jgi:putative glutamine amidotransferase
MKPLIGICCRLMRTAQGDRFYLQREYSEAVLAAGGIPVLLPLLAGLEYARAVAARLDGIMLSGSASDVEPARYGAEPHPKLGEVHQERDALDSALVEQALATGKPLLGICFGTQALNVALGGTLVQHLETGIEHSDANVRHKVLIEPGSLLARLGGAGEHLVNTSHHQAIDRVAPPLRVTAHAPDGTIEAVETTEPRRFLVGVQWHPERIWKESGISRALFEELVRRSAEFNV